MSEFIEIMNQRDRMCKMYTDEEGQCSRECPLWQEKPPAVSCFEYVCRCSGSAEKVVSDWSKEYPVVTNKDKFKEVLREIFGLSDEDTVSFNLAHCNGFDCPKGINLHSCSNCKWDDFWEQEYKGPEIIEQSVKAISDDCASIYNEAKLDAINELNDILMRMRLADYPLDSELEKRVKEDLRECVFNELLNRRDKLNQKNGDK